MTTNKYLRNSNAFTLIELLIVIGIIGLLFALLMPGIGAARLAAYRNTARQEMAGIENALMGFFAEYGRYPLQDTGAHDSRFAYGRLPELRPGYGNAAQVLGYIQLINSLRGLDPADNPRGTVYLNVTDRSIFETMHPSIDPSEDKQFLDPWMNRYAVVADWNMDGNVNSFVHDTLTNRTVAVWSWGPGGEHDSNETGRHLKSWVEP